MKIIRQITAFSSVFLVACAPLQQAPLLYSSKTTVGLDVSTSTTESPGASISIGVKVVDAAYVPVAVSKGPETSNGKNDLSYDIVKIEAVFGEGATTGKLDSLTEENKTRIREYLAAKQEEEIAASAQKKTEDELKELPDKIEISKKAIADNGEAIKALPPDVDQTTKNSAQVKLVNSQKLNAELISMQQVLTQQLDAKKLEYQSAKVNSEKLFLAAAQAASLLRTDKRDAMSVYGRFNAETSATASSSPSTTLTSGKIFSTGVASQNLTEAAKAEARFGYLARCVESLAGIAKGITDEGKRNEFLSKLDTLCSGTATAASK